MPKVSVIVPVYGVEKYIERCARSLFEQTLDDIEYLFIDDCTPDKSIEILNQVMLEYPNRISQVTIHCMEQNSGQAKVREWGIRNATGEYVIHCDSDDWVDKQIYKTLYNEAISNGYDLVSCDYYRSDGKDNKLVSVKENMRLLQGPLWNRLVKRSIYVDNEIIYPTANKAEDGALMTQISFYSKKRKHIALPLYYYFENTNSICGDVSAENCVKRLQQEMANTELRIRFLKEHHALEEFKSEILIWKYITKNNLLPVISDYKYYSLWKETYSEITFDFLMSKDFALKTKLNYILRYLRIKKS